jgi:N-sulfoglucosamine sulfohydrolase
MRSIVTREYGYIFNPWSNGSRRMATATKGTATYRRMNELAKRDPDVAARLKLFENRVPEELYNYRVDPDALVNLIDSPEHHEVRERLVKALDAWMVRSGDPMLEVFRNRHDLSVREAYMAQVEKEAAGRRTPRNRDND